MIFQFVILFFVFSLKGIEKQKNFIFAKVYYFIFAKVKLEFSTKKKNSVTA